MPWTTLQSRGAVAEKPSKSTNNPSPSLATGVADEAN